MNTKRILIVGDSGRGKSSLAKKLGEKLGIQYHSTDDFFWKIKFSLPEDKNICLENISKVYKKVSWIVEGSTRSLIQEGLEKSDQIIHLIHPSLIHQYWILFKRKLTREETWPNLFNLYIHLFKKKYKLGEHKGRATLEEMLQPYTNKIIKLKSFQEIDEFLKGKS